MAVDKKTENNKNTNGNKAFTEEEIEFLQKLLPKVKSGAKVMHKVFGEGIIIGLKDRNSKIVVRFSSGEKVFIFPDSFIKGFLEMVK